MTELSQALLTAALLLIWFGFSLLALSQERHFGCFYLSFKPSDQWKYAQVAIGIIAILSSLPLCIKAQNAGFGSLLWVLMVTASAMTVALQLTWLPSTLQPLAWIVRSFSQGSFDVLEESEPTR